MIDVLLATYNGEKFLKEQIDSILKQSFKDRQMLIRDDGSTDSTVEIIKSYVNKYPDKIKLIEDNLGNLGVGRNFGTLLEHSQSQYSMFCDQDDVWLPEKIELTLNKMKEAENLHPDLPILVFTDLTIVDENLNVIAKSLWSYHKINPQKASLLKNLAYRSAVTGCTIMINKRAREISLPIPEVSRVHDWWVALNTAKYGKIVYLSQPTVLYRQHPKNVVGTLKKSMTPSVFVQKLKNFFSRFGRDYKTSKKICPNVNIVVFLLKNLQNSIQRKI